MVILCGVAALGCVPFGWVLPPAHVDVAGGVSSVAEAPVDEGDALHEREETLTPSGAFDARAMLAPLQAIPRFSERHLDVEAGYGMRYLSRAGRIEHGPLLALSVLAPLDERKRLVFGTQLGLLIGTASQGNGVLGNRIAGRIGFEWRGWGSGEFQSCDIEEGGFCGSGYAHGERSIAPYLEVSRALLYGDRELGVMLGLSFRIPASVGAGLLFCDPGDCW